MASYVQVEGKRQKISTQKRVVRCLIYEHLKLKTLYRIADLVNYKIRPIVTIYHNDINLESDISDEKNISASGVIL